jgi:AcrR family transcriptional regulator
MIMVEDTATPAPLRRPGGRNARVRERMLSATAQIVGTRGIGGLRYEDVAELAGVHKSSVYRNWPDRRKLISDALAFHAEEIAVMPDSGDIRADLVQFLMTLAGALATPEGRALVLALAADRDHADVRAIAQNVLERRVAVVRHRIDKAVERGQLPPVDATFFAEMLGGPVYLYVNRRAQTFTRADAERITDVVLAGVRVVRP